MSSQRTRVDHVSTVRTGSTGIPRTIPRQYDDSRSGSENDMSTDLEGGFP